VEHVTQATGHIMQAVEHVTQATGHIMQALEHVTQATGHIMQAVEHVTKAIGHLLQAAEHTKRVSVLRVPFQKGIPEIHHTYQLNLQKMCSTRRIRY
jgi:methyl-accepting chemotaxis protein